MDTEARIVARRCAFHRYHRSLGLAGQRHEYSGDRPTRTILEGELTADPRASRAWKQFGDFRDRDDAGLRHARILSVRPLVAGAPPGPRIPAFPCVRHGRAPIQRCRAKREYDRHRQSCARARYSQRWTETPEPCTQARVTTPTPHSPTRDGDNGC